MPHSIKSFARKYHLTARGLANQWDRPYLHVLAKLMVSRIIFGRSAAEFEKFMFAVKSAREWRSYLRDDERTAWQEAVSPFEFRCLEENKVLFWQRCVEKGLATVPIIAVIPGGTDLLHGVHPPMAPTPEAFAACLSSVPGEAFFAKPVGGGQAYGIDAFTVSEGSIKARGSVTSVQEYFERLVRSRYNKSGYIIQPKAEPHESLLPVMPGPGVGNLRITSIRMPSNEVELCWAHLKLPGTGCNVTTPRHGGLVVRVDANTGQLGPAAARTSKKPFCHQIDRHPETGVAFSTMVLPMFQEALQLVRDAADAFPELPCLGWDIVFTPAGPMLLETNWNFGMASNENSRDRGMRKEFIQLYQPVRVAMAEKARAKI